MCGIDEVRGVVTGITTNLGTTALQSLVYDYDANLNVKSRTDSVAGVLEQFHYDSLDRIHDWQEVGSYGWGVTHSHDDIGNLTGRSLLGGKGETEALTFEHSGVNAGPHAVTTSAWGTYGYDGKGNQTSSPEGTIAYTYFNLPKSIVGTDTSTFKYDASGARVLKSAGATGTTIYAGGTYERRTVAGSKTHVFYLNTSGRQIGQILRKESDQSETVLYIHSDSLGSSEVVTDANGQVVGERRKYDPFGAPTDITLPKAFPGGSLMSTDVHIGFTGHEEDSETGLINMRGRIYNPLSFGQADPIFYRKPLNVFRECHSLARASAAALPRWDVIGANQFRTPPPNSLAPRAARIFRFQMLPFLQPSKESHLTVRPLELR